MEYCHKYQRMFIWQNTYQNLYGNVRLQSPKHFTDSLLHWHSKNEFKFHYNYDKSKFGAAQESS